MSNKLIGTNPNQVPSNADLGTLAYQDADSANLGTLLVTDKIGIDTSGTDTLNSPYLFTVADESHGVAIDYVSAYPTKPGGLFSTAGGSTWPFNAYGNMILTTRTDYGGYYDIALVTASTDNTPEARLVVKHSGKVGIGTDDPTTTLSVVNDSTNEGFNVRHSNNTAGIGIGYNTIQATGTNTDQSIYLMSKGAADILFYTNGTQRLHIDSLGTVGIGTTSGEANLVVRDVTDGTHKGGRIGFGIHEAGALQIYDAVHMSKTAGSIVTDSTASGGQNVTLSSGQLYGPYHTLPRGSYRLCVKMKTTDASYTGSAARLTCHVSSGTVIPESRIVRGVDFGTNNKWQSFSVPFQVVGAATNAVEFYLFALNSQAISVDYFFIMNDTDSYSTKVYGDQIVDGNVGIGQTPGTNNKLVVRGTVVGTAANLAETASLAILSLNYPRGNTNSGMHFGYANANYIQAADDSGANSKKLTLNPFGGNVAIGSTGAEVKLEVNGGADDSVVFGGRSDGGNGNNRRFNLIAFADGGGSNYGGGLKIQTRDDVNVFHDRVTVKSNGNVGINNTNPTRNLDVSGVLSADNYDWGSSNAVFGQDRYRIRELNNWFWAAGKRFGGYGSSSIPSNSMFDGNFDSGHNFAANSTHVITIDHRNQATLTYPSGDAYFSFYHVQNQFTSITGRAYHTAGGSAGTWSNLGTATDINGGAGSGGRVVRLSGPPGNYIGMWEFTIVTGSASVTVTDLSYHMTRATGENSSPAFRVDRTQDVVSTTNYRNDAGTVVGTIVPTSSGCTFNNLSDYRFKQNVTDITGASDRLKLLKPKNFSWITDETDTLEDGFLAHEVAEVIPNAVIGEKDAIVPPELYGENDPIPEGSSVGDVKLENGEMEPQLLDQVKLIPLLTAALKEALDRIEVLEQG